MAGTLMPLGKLQVFDNDGLPAAGYQLFTYETGTTTKLATYSDVNLTIPNTNPIILDAAGRATVFAAAASYKQVLAPPTDSDPPTVPLWTVDGIAGTPSTVNNLDLEGTAGEVLTDGQTAYMSDGSGGLTAGYWYLTDSDHNYSSVDAPTRGIVTVGAAAGNTVTIRVQGRYDLGGSLSQGAVYYLDATAGALNTSDAQQNRCPFGQADSPTSIVFPIEGTISISIKSALATFGFSAGQGNDATDTDTELTSYTTSIPDNYLDQPGAMIVVEGLVALANNTRVKTMKLSIGGSGLLSVFSNNDAVAAHYVPFRMRLIRRTATTAAVTGLFYKGATNLGATTPMLVNHLLSGTIDWTIAQDLKLYAATDTAGHANDIRVTEVSISQIRSPYGALV